MKISVDKILLVMMLFVVSCGSSSVRMNKYMIEELSLKNASTIDFKDKIITISSVKQSPVMRSGQIPYKLSKVQVNYFIGDKWVARVDDLFKRRLFEVLKGSGMFLDVYDGPSMVESDYMLSVYIDYLGEELIDNQRYATVMYDIRIVDKDNKTIFFDEVHSRALIEYNIKNDDYVSKLVEKLSENISSTLNNSFVKFYNSLN